MNTGAADGIPRSIRERLLVLGALFGGAASLFLPTFRFLGVGNGWQSLWLSVSLLQDPADLLHGTIFLSGPTAAFAAFLWLPTTSFIIGARWLIRGGRLKYIRAAGVASVASFLYTAMAPFILDIQAFLVGFWVWLASLAIIAFVLSPFHPLAGRRAPSNNALQRTRYARR